MTLEFQADTRQVSAPVKRDRGVDPDELSVQRLAVPLEVDVGAGRPGMVADDPDPPLERLEPHPLHP